MDGVDCPMKAAFGYIIVQSHRSFASITLSFILSFLLSLFLSFLLYLFSALLLLSLFLSFLLYSLSVLLSLFLSLSLSMVYARFYMGTVEVRKFSACL